MKAIYFRAAPDGALCRVVPYLIAAGAVCLLISIVVGNWHFRDPNIVPTADYAVTSLHTFDALRFSQLYGIPSFHGYSHPGPVLMYYRASGELIVSIFKADVSPLFVHMLMHALLVTISFVSIYYYYSIIPFVTRLQAFIFSNLVLLSWLLKPSVVISMWEPDIAALLFAPFVVSAVAAFFGRGVGLIGCCFIAGICVQLQAPFAYPVIPILILAGVGFMRSRRWNYRNCMPEIRAIVAISIVLSLPVLIDLVVNQAANINAMRRFSAVAATMPAPTMAAIIDIIRSAVAIPSRSPSTMDNAAAISLMAVGVYIAVRQNEAATERGRPWEMRDSFVFIGFLLLAFGGIILFYKISATAAHAASHPAHFSYHAVAVTLAAILAGIVRNTWADSPRVKVTWAVALVLAIVAIVSYAGGPGRIWHHDLVPHTVAELPNLRSLGNQMARRDPEEGRQPIGFAIAFDATGSAEQRELPWRTAVGLMNILRRAGVSYCMQPNAKPDDAFSYGIMRLYGKMQECRGEQVSQVSFSCQQGFVVARWEDQAVQITTCRQ